MTKGQLVKIVEIYYVGGEETLLETFKMTASREEAAGFFERLAAILRGKGQS